MEIYFFQVNDKRTSSRFGVQFDVYVFRVIHFIWKYILFAGYLYFRELIYANINTEWTIVHVQYINKSQTALLTYWFVDSSSEIRRTVDVQRSGTFIARRAWENARRSMPDLGRIHHWPVTPGYLHSNMSMWLPHDYQWPEVHARRHKTWLPLRKICYLIH